ncbi:hypothetical protein [Burkholderia sp. HI2500]|uniref:hypothetical protein n=1 Tax=Burkholderia sp. HI2500 TaxID=2015358 RepID=UPI00117EBF06|nr:hypothetical protein [Burkholderia sp. HI2500]
MDTSKFSNPDAVIAAMRRAAENLVPTSEELARHTEQDKRDALPNACLRNVARALAHDAADALEPLAGQLIDEDSRNRLARSIAQALYDNLPPLRNLVAE